MDRTGERVGPVHSPSMQPLRIDRPCDEEWSEMRREAGGRHCAACDRTVVDVTRATAAELTAKAMLFGRDGHFCGQARVNEEGIVELRVPRAPARRSVRRTLAVATALSLPLGCAEAEHTTVAVAEAPAPTSPPAAPAPTSATTVADVVVEPTECPRPGSVQTDGKIVVVVKGEMPIVRYIHFPSLSVALGADDQSIIDETANTLAQNPDIVRLKIVGHADSTESGAVELGMKRATVVANLLVSKGIAASRVEATSAGSTQPVRANDSPEGRAANRRITFEPIRE